MHNTSNRIEAFEADLAGARKFRKANGRPFILVSYAQSLDGSIATAGRQQMQLSGPESMRLTHRLRTRCQSILVGIGTVLADNPSLTVRLAQGPNPQPIILDTRLRTPADANIVQRSDLSTWIINGDHNRFGGIDALAQSNVTIIGCRLDDDGLIDLQALMDILDRRQIDSVMVEGGARVITSFIKLKLADLFVVTVAPKLAGGLPVIDSRGLQNASNLRLADVCYQRLGQDLVVWAHPDWSQL